MATNDLPGHLAKVTIGANTVVGLGTWRMDGITSDEFDASEFTDNWKTYEFGMKDGGTITFDGKFRPDDTTGQEALREANLENTDLTDLRFYIDSASYFVPNQTAGYFSPGVTTGASTEVSNVNITALNIEADKGDLQRISFTARVSGCMALV